MKDISETRGYNVIAGISLGYKVMISGDILFAGEGDNIYPVGFAIAIGAGLGIETHINMINTWKLSVEDWISRLFETESDKCINY